MTHSRTDLVGKSEIACVENHGAEMDEELARVVPLHIQRHFCHSECAVKAENLHVVLPTGSVLVVLSVLHGPVRQGNAFFVEAGRVGLEVESCRGRFVVVRKQPSEAGDVLVSVAQFQLPHSLMVGYLIQVLLLGLDEVVKIPADGIERE